MRRAGASSAPDSHPMERAMLLRIDPSGGVSCLYGEAIDLTTLGQVTIRRASHVEPDASGRWYADLSPVGGPCLGSFARRSEALDAERLWLEQFSLGLAH